MTDNENQVKLTLATDAANDMVYGIDPLQKARAAEEDVDDTMVGKPRKFKEL